jgi:hypothetical protein
MKLLITPKCFKQNSSERVGTIIDYWTPHSTSQVNLLQFLKHKGKIASYLSSKMF